MNDADNLAYYSDEEIKSMLYAWYSYWDAKASGENPLLPCDFSEAEISREIIRRDNCKGALDHDQRISDAIVWSILNPIRIPAMGQTIFHCAMCMGNIYNRRMANSGILLLKPGRW